MSEMRIYKYNGVLIGDNRVDEIVSLANNGGLDAHFDVDAKDAEVSVGNVAVGTKLAGLSLKKIIEMMVYEEQNPVLTDPSIKIECDKHLYAAAGTAFSTSGQVIFNRGSISPRYETSGYRSGEPTSYKIGEKTVETDSHICPFTYQSEALQLGANTLSIVVNYAEGEQPLTSHMNNYMSPLPAGSISEELVVTGIAPVFAGVNESSIQEVVTHEEYIHETSREYELQGLVADDEGVIGYQVTLHEAQALNDAQVFMLQSDIKLSGIQAYDRILNQWTWFQGDNAEETITSNAFKDGGTEIRIINGKEVEYKKYIYNVEDFGTRGEDYFRFLFK